jgi:dTDP-4-amino-4,6-dideoxygalactose transaminase
MSREGHNRLAIHGGAPVRGPESHWPSWPIFGDPERRALNAVLESGKWWYGEQVAAFEAAYAAFQGAGYCVSCTSGTTAIEIALEALGVGADDEVIVPPYTFIATASAVARVGATPVFVDVDASWCMDPERIHDAITPRTKVVMPVHFGGRCCDMDRINAVARMNGLTVIEDACHSWGARWRDQGAGTLGLAGVFSFQMSKNITAGEGGAIVTNDEDFAETCRSLTNCGRSKGGRWYAHSRAGTNARLTEFQGALLHAQLSRLEVQTELRERNAALLNDALGRIEGLIPQPGDERITRRSYHLYCLRIDPGRFGCSRSVFVAAAEAEGLPVGEGYAVPLYEQPVFRDGDAPCVQHPCPVAEDLCYRSGMWIPHQILLGSEADMRDIIAIAQKLKARAGEL